MYLAEDEYFINEDIQLRKEFKLLKSTIAKNVVQNPYMLRYDSEKWIKKNKHTMLKSYQVFVGNYFNPNTPYTRLLMKWETGVGKTIGSLSIAIEYIKVFRELNENAEFQGSVFVLGFTEEIFRKELMSFSQFGLVSEKELDTLRRLQEQNPETNTSVAEQIRELTAKLRRRQTNRKGYGFFKFCGYKTVSNRLFNTTLNIISMTRDEIISKINSGEIKLNIGFLEKFANSLIICDEIHRLYNSVDKNNWGVAIELILNFNNSCRALFLSATPLNNSPTEIIDLLNLLLPHDKYEFIKKTDIFDNNNNPTKEGIAKLQTFLRGRVSFVRDVNPMRYASKELVGDSIEGIDMLKFIRCPMSSFHYATYKKIYNGTLSIDGIYLSDICLPNPRESEPFAATGLFRTNEIREIYAESSAQWRNKYKLHLKNEEIVGDALSLDRDLPKISAKYTKMMQTLLQNLKKGNGKTFIYHNSKQISGVFFIESVLRANGFIGADEESTDDSICFYCTATKKQHSANHQFVPVRMIILHGDMDKKEVSSFLERFNKPSNTDGTKISVLVASRFMKESYTMRAVQNLMVMSRPDNISILLQIIGRAVRDSVHKLLPPEKRHVRIFLFVTSVPGCKELSYEEIKYKEKVDSNKIVRVIEKIMHESAIDGLINEEMIWQKKGEVLDIEPYKSNICKQNYKNCGTKNEVIEESTFWAYFSEYALEYVKYMIKTCFVSYSPVWKYVDLWKIVTNPPFQTVIDPKMIDQSLFNIALHKLLFKNNNDTFKPVFADDESITIEDNSFVIVHCGDYYMLVNYDLNTKTPYLEIESFFRSIQNVKKKNYSIKEYLLFDQNTNFINKKERFITRWRAVDFKNMKNAIYMFGYDFHLQFIELCIANVYNFYIENKKVKDIEFYIKLIQFYSLFGVVVFANMVHEPIRSIYTKYVNFDETLPDVDIINNYISSTDISWITTGMVKKFNSMLQYDSSKKKKINAHFLPVGHFFGAQPRFYTNEWKTYPEYLRVDSKIKENDIVIGYEEKEDYINIKFKLRSPIHNIKKFNDQRRIERGMTCFTKNKKQLVEIAKKLSLTIESNDSNRELCAKIKAELLYREVKAREKKTCIKWFYTFFDTKPDI